MKTNILIVVFFLLLAVHVNADCASDCSDAYNAALEQCAGNYSRAAKQCADDRDNALKAARNTRNQAVAMCNMTYDSAIRQCAKDEWSAQDICNTTAENEIKTADVIYKADKYLCGGDPECLAKAGEDYCESLRETAGFLVACIDNAAKVRDACEGSANAELTGRTLIAESAYLSALYAASVRHTVCVDAAKASRDNCINAASSAYSACLTKCNW